jgi:hypothetical protein
LPTTKRNTRKERDMAYLDEDILYNNIEEKYKVAKGEARSAYSDVLDTICEMPRADVVSLAEVAIQSARDAGAILGLQKRIRIVEVENALYKKADEIDKMVLPLVKEEHAKEIFAEIEKHSTLLFDGVRNIVVLTETDFENFKKKYTGDRDES